MFRCPNCAVVWKLQLTDNHVLLAQQNMDSWAVYKEPLSFFTHIADVKTDAELLDVMLKHSLSVEMEQTCASCKQTAPVETWREAWKHPIDFFDADNLCHCGGELWWDKIPYTSRYAHICEKCGWAKPKAVLSGSAGD